ncbi:MAG: DUF2784 domain-containing protein [Rhodothermales bacterium]|nr:DUF2784 domain-containing protein [Rhodothermales bacterium]
MYEALDIFFFAFHTTLVGFNLTGWIWKKTRRLHLLTIGLTWLSWLGLGVFYGFGYCPSTDWHWDVKARLGETDLPASYVKYYLDAATGLDWNAALVDASVAALGIGALVASATANLRDYRRTRAQNRSDSGVL